jgi:hypothetical protein
LYIGQGVTLNGPYYFSLVCEKCTDTPSKPHPQLPTAIQSKELWIVQEKLCWDGAKPRSVSGVKGKNGVVRIELKKN